MPGRSEVPQFDVTPAAVQIRAHEAAEQTAKREQVFEYLPQAVRKFIDWHGNWEQARAAWQKQFPQSFNFAQRISVSSVLGHFFITLADFEGVVENTDFALDRNYDHEMNDNDPYATTYEIMILETATVEYLFAELEEASTPVWEAQLGYTPKPGASQYDQQTQPQDAAAEQLSESDAALQVLRAEILEEMRTTQGRNGRLYTALNNFTDPWFGTHEREEIAPILPGEFISILERIFAAFGLQKYRDYSTGTVNGTRQCLIIHPEQRAALAPVVETLVGLQIELQKVDPRTLTEEAPQDAPKEDVAKDSPPSEQPSETPAVNAQTREEVDTTEVLTLTNRDKESISRELDIFVHQVLNGIIFVKQATGRYSKRTLAIEPTQLFYRWLKARAQHEVLTPVLNIRMKGADLRVSAKKGSTPETVITALVAVCAAEDITVPTSLTQFLPKELQDETSESSEEVPVFDSRQEEHRGERREQIPEHLQKLVATTILFTYNKLFSELTLMHDYTITVKRTHDTKEFFHFIQHIAAAAKENSQVRAYLEAWEVSITDSEARLSLKPAHRDNKNAEFEAFSLLGEVLEYLEEL